MYWRLNQDKVMKKKSRKNKRKLKINRRNPVAKAVRTPRFRSRVELDRKKEMIIVGGFNVYPREIDEVLTNHPAVAEAATVGVSDSFSGEVPHAFVALVPGAEVNEEALITYCSNNLIKYKHEFINSIFHY